MKLYSILEKLILYFVYQNENNIVKTQLVRFLYLADLYSVKWTSKQLTDLDWYFYIDEPWSEGVDLALEQLKSQVTQKHNDNIMLIQLKMKFIDLNTLEISRGLQFMLDNIQREWGENSDKKVDGLSEYIYSTEPILAVKDKFKSSEKVRLNLALERDLLIET